MSTAILISGQLRTFARCLPLQHWLVYRHFPDCEFFLVVQDTPDVQAVDDLRNLYGKDRVHIDARKDPDLHSHITPALSAAWHRAPYANAAPAHQLLLQHHYQREVWRYFCERAPDREERFDTIIRMRGDNRFISFEKPIDGPLHFNTCHTPWWGRFSGLNDRFAIMGLEAAGSYFTLFDSIPELIAKGCPFHPESLLKAKLESDRVRFNDDLQAEFSTLRANGEERWPEITPIDMAHAALTRAA